MKQLLRVVEEPRACSYLPVELAALEYRIVTGLVGDEYDDLLARGYRRFGYQLFRPSCPRCQECVSLRVLAQEFTPTASQRRVLRKNAHIRVKRTPVYASKQHVDLFNRFHRFMSRRRGWQRDEITKEAYQQSFVLGGGNFACQWLYFDADRLVGVALMDETPEAISLVYFFHDPAWRALGPGTFSIVTQLAYARRRRLRYAYPGYWIADNPSMNYKARFRPHERLLRHPADDEQPIWQRV